MIQVAVMGYGTIGSGVVEVLETNQEIIKQRTGHEIAVKYILDLREFPGTTVEHKIVHDFETIVNDPEVRIVVEAMGGVNPAYPFVKACLEGGKHVTTSNKALVAAHGTELLQIAREKQVNFLFEASVGGGIPVIRPLYRCLGGEKITEITGVLNGTTNFILTKMDQQGESFDRALEEAQRLGYAERNPEADVEGHDTCRKISILTAMATGHETDYEQIETKGITHITDIDFKYAKKIGKSIKLLGSSQITDEGVNAWVAPVMVGTDHPLYSVNDVYNAIMVKGNMLGTTMFYGSGAGKLPTASAVVADIIEISQNLLSNIQIGWDQEQLQIQAGDFIKYRYFVRVGGCYENQKEAVTEIFPEAELITLEGMDEYAILTKAMSRKELDQLLGTLKERVKSSSSDGIRQVIQVD